MKVETSFSTGRKLLLNILVVLSNNIISKRFVSGLNITTLKCSISKCCRSVINHLKICKQRVVNSLCTVIKAVNVFWSRCTEAVFQRKKRSNKYF